MEWLVIWLIMGGVVALIANSKGRSGGAWFFYGVLIWPIALVHILVSSPTSAAAERRAFADGRRPCPHCAEMVKVEASLCPHCRSELPTDWASASSRVSA